MVVLMRALKKSECFFVGGSSVETACVLAAGSAGVSAMASIIRSALWMICSARVHLCSLNLADAVRNGSSFS